MQNQSEPHFQVKVPGKWILAGEHTVLRGGEALVFPLMSRFLDLKYFKNEDEFDIQLTGHVNSELELIIWSVLEKAFKKLNIKRSQIKGLISLNSQIDFGAGMGASATLCVSLTKLFSYLGYLNEPSEYEFARELENLFHGESSGVDIAVTLYQKPLLFSRNGGFEKLNHAVMPNLFLSHTGSRGVTKDCVEKVKKLLILEPELGMKIDQDMKDVVNNFKILLHEKDSILNWIQNLNKAHNCFEQWGLVNESVKKHQQKLLEAGALSVKLTGSGNGGYMLSLWKENPPSTLPFEMIPCFR